MNKKTSVKDPLGIEAASQMISHIENPGLPATKIIVPHVLVERKSCSPPS